MAALRLHLGAEERVRGMMSVEAVLQFLERHQEWSFWVALVFASAETLAFLSLLVPSTAILVAVGATISTGALSMFHVWAGAALGAVIGSTVSWWLGQRYGARILASWPMNREPQLVERATDAFRRWGLPVPDYGPLDHWKAPDLLVWPVIACGILLLVPSLGAEGAAYGTLGARLAMVAALVVWITRMSDARELGILTRAPRSRAAEAEQRRIGYGAGVSFFAETAAFSSMNIVAGWVGGLAVAGWAIVLNVAAIIFMVVDLPAPLRPINATTSPSATVSSAGKATPNSGATKRSSPANAC